MEQNSDKIYTCHMAQAHRHKKKIIIPSNYQIIDEKAFAGFSEIEKVVIPKSINEIKCGAFANCPKLRKVIFKASSDNKTHRMIGSHAFSNCASLKSVVLTNGISVISEKAFSNCVSLKKIVLSSTVEYIMKDAFTGCPLLEKIKIHAHNTSFYGHNAIIDRFSQKLLLGTWKTKKLDNVEIIGRNAFKGCINLTSINLPVTLKKIETHAFSMCYQLTEIVIPHNVYQIEGNVFRYCHSLGKIVVDPKNLVYDSRQTCNGIIKTSEHKLLVGCVNTYLPDDLITISDYAFCGCLNLERFIGNNSLEKIGKKAFSGCFNLREIKIASNVKHIDETAFFDCLNLLKIEVSKNNRLYDSRHNCNGLINTTTNEMLVRAYRSYVPEGVTDLSEYKK